ncbi:Minor tail protein Z [Escherichia coli]|uniref:Minor tail protein Z n=1 Tax=Escherichia coli TaxID=562 RepID=A0A376DJR2_ECOLX|nr:Minor tail protein Z [Escherichia coli]
MAIKGLAQAMKNLDAIDRRAVPRASATTLNRVAGAIIAKTATSVARELAVPRRLIRARIRLSPARPDKGLRKGLHQYRQPARHQTGGGPRSTFPQKTEKERTACGPERGAAVC